MLFTQRMSYALMPSWWKPVHRALWWLRTHEAIPDLVWRTYRRMWPAPIYLVGERGSEMWTRGTPYKGR